MRKIWLSLVLLVISSASATEPLKISSCLARIRATQGITKSSGGGSTSDPYEGLYLHLNDDETAAAIAHEASQSRFDPRVLFSNLIESVRFQLQTRPLLLQKILSDQIANPLALIILDAHDPNFLLKWASWAPAHGFLVWRNAHRPETILNANVFERKRTFKETLKVFLRECSLQGAVGVAFGASTQSVINYLHSAEPQSYSEQKIFERAATSGAYFFLTGCVRYQLLDKAQMVLPDTALARGVIGPSLYFTNSIVSAALIGLISKVSGAEKTVSYDLLDKPFSGNKASYDN